MATFLEERLDVRITRGATTQVTQPGRRKTYVSGALEQDFNNTLPVHKYEVSHGLKPAIITSGITVANAYALVLNLFYNVMFTPHIGFRYKDWSDYRAVKDNSALVLISGTTWQLRRKHTYGSVSFYRPIYKPVSGTVLVYSAADALLPATVDYATGQAVVTGTPSYWTGEFDIPVTFSNDSWSATLETNVRNLRVVSGSIQLEEIRL